MKKTIILLFVLVASSCFFAESVVAVPIIYQSSGTVELASGTDIYGWDGQTFSTYISIASDKNWYINEPTWTLYEADYGRVTIGSQVWDDVKSQVFYAKEDRARTFNRFDTSDNNQWRFVVHSLYDYCYLGASNPIAIKQDISMGDPDTLFGLIEPTRNADILPSYALVPETFTAKPVSEPATMLLLGSGLVGLAGFGRKKFFKSS